MSFQSIITVIVTCYSGQRFFEETVKSVKDQTFTNIKIMIHDNGCDASYRAEIQRVARRYGAEVFTSVANQYGEGLRFEVLPTVLTEYVSIIHDDDMYYPSKLAAGLAQMERENLDYLFTDRQCIDASGAPLDAHAENLNMEPIRPGDFPIRLLSELFYKGMRLHFSTLILRTSLAKSTLLGDPYIPRIADTLFFSRLLSDRSLKGAVSPERMTAVRIHGGNDYLYNKFGADRREQQFFQLSMAEFYVFQDVVLALGRDDLAEFLAAWPGVYVEPSDDRVALLVKAALWLRPWDRAKKLIAALCVHTAFKEAPRRTIELMREISGADANSEMIRLYDDYTAGEVRIFGGSLDRSSTYRRELRDVYSSTSWRITAPLRWIRRRVGPKGGELWTDAVRHGHFPTYEVGREVDLSSEEAGRYIETGFAPPEPWGRWTDGPQARIVVNLGASSGDALIMFDIAMVYAPNARSCEVAIRLNGERPQTFVFQGGRRLPVPVPRGALSQQGDLEIEMHVFQPKKQGAEPAEEPRRLGVGLAGFSITWA